MPCVHPTRHTCLLLLLPPPLLDRAVAANSNAEIFCTRTGDVFPPMFSVTVSASGCAAAGSATTVVSAPCLISSTAYARNGATASTCLARTLNCTGTAVGFVNTIPSTNSAINFPMFAGTCTARASAGTAAVRCLSTTNTASQVTLNLPQLVATGTPAHFFYVGCTLPSGDNRCSPDAGFNAPACSTQPVSSCGGALTAPRVVNLNCGCSSVRWVLASVATAPATIQTPRVNGVCPSSP